MKITIDGKKLAKELAALKSVMPSRPTLPVLGTVQVTAGDGKVTLHATDMDRHLECSLECQVDGSADFCIRADRLLLFAGGDLSIKWADDVAVLTGGEKKSRVPTLRAKEMPPWPPQAKDAVSYGSFPADDIATVYDTSLTMCSEDASRYVLTGPALDVDGYLIATDGKSGDRRKWADISVDAVTTLSSHSIRHAMGGDECRIVIGLAAMEIHSGNRRYLTKRIEGTYPNAKYAMPQCWKDDGKEKWAKVKRSELIDALSYLSTVADGQIKAMTAEFSDGQICFSTSTRTEERHEINVTAILDKTSVPDSVGLDPERLLRIVRAATLEEIEIGIINAFSPVCVKSDVRSVMMPMTIRP